MILWLLSIHFCCAQYFTGPIASGMGGASLGAVESGEGHLLNPAVLVHGQPIEASLVFRNGGYVETDQQKTYGISITNNDPQTYFPGAITFLRSSRNKGVPADEQFLQFSIAEFAGQNFSVGIAGVRLSQKIFSVAGEQTQWNGVFGLLYNPTPDFAIGFTAAYFVHPSTVIPIDFRLQPTLGLGLHYLFLDFLRARLDVLSHYEEVGNQRLAVKGGFETASTPMTIIRLGARQDDSTTLTLGLGFNGPRLKLDYAYEKDANRAGSGMHSVDLRLLF